MNRLFFSENLDLIENELYGWTDERYRLRWVSSFSSYIQNVIWHFFFAQLSTICFYCFSVKNLSTIGTYAGNDAIVAFARLYQTNVVIHQLNSPFLLVNINRIGLWLWCLMPLSTIFQFYIVEVRLIGGGNRSTRRKPPACRKSLTNFITYCYIEYTSSWAGFELTTLVAI
jgi:hypothetical protein